MNRNRFHVLDPDHIKLAGVFYVSQTYSEEHAHMIHKHHDILELLYVASGKGRYFVGGREYIVQQGDLVICNAGTLHGEAPFQKHAIETYCCALSGVQLEGLPTGCMLPPDQRPVLPLENYTYAASRIMPSIYELLAGSAENAPICLNLAVSIFMMAQSALCRRDQSSNTAADQKNEAFIRKVTEYMDHHYTEPLTLDSISAAMHISSSHLSHLFKRETGLSPIQYVIHRRIGRRKAC